MLSKLWEVIITIIYGVNLLTTRHSLIALVFAGQLGAIATPILATRRSKAVDTVVNDTAAITGLPAMARRPTPPIANMVMVGVG